MGVCFAGVRKLRVFVEKDGGWTIPTNLYHKWLASAVQIQNMNELMNRRCVELQELVKNAGFQSYIMKGQWMVYLKSFRFWRFDKWAWFWSPICRIKGFMWRKINGYK